MAAKTLQYTRESAFVVCVCVCKGGGGGGGGGRGRDDNKYIPKLVKA